MSGIAKVLLDLGYKVSGSDLNMTDTTKRLQENGALVYSGHRADNVVEGVDTVVVSTAIPGENEEVKKAQKLNISVIQRAEMLAKLMQNQKAICIAGAHGKTTTTSMIALVLEKNNFDPTVVVGGELNDIGGNAKLGRGEYLVAEADESDGSFLKLLPWSTVITNIEDDHLDHYGSLENIIQAFNEFVDLGGPTGFSVLCVDNPYVKELAKHVPGKLITYGLTESADYTARDIVYEGLVTKAQIYYKENFIGELELNVPGKHNISNALAAISVGGEFGIENSEILKALKSFQGVQRRFQLIGKVNNIQIVDDYAHHPTEIKATLLAARNSHNGRIIAIFQPHRYTRTKFLAKEFGQSFIMADKLILDEVYSAGEKLIPGVTTQNIVENLPAETDVAYFKEYKDIMNYLASIVKPGDLVITLGAGNIWRVGVDLVDILLKEKEALASV
ncbi:MAG: UDP-N-acetylmuramate--alanine ligase [Peptococcaceae bacterium BICA1-8]|nr:MAG: UDP-N-acetylmuramate--alanine ligase [Peptococcaceae bacterium BICA1-8]